MNCEKVTFFLFSLALFICGSGFVGSTFAQTVQEGDEPRWYELNEQLIERFDVSERNRSDIPATGVHSNIGEGNVRNITTLPSIELAEGVTAKMHWGVGNLMSFVNLEPNSEMPGQTIRGERFLFVLKGDVQELVNGDYVTLRAIEREEPTGVSGQMPVQEFIYLEEGAESAVRSGENGARILEIYAPVPPEYLEKSGALVTGTPYDLGALPSAATIKPGQVYDLYDFQYTELVPGANSRLISGRGTQLSFLRMNPGIEFAYHLHPEEQVMIGFRGWIDEYVLADTVRMHSGDIVTLPAEMVHGGKLGPYGSDALDVFFPPRPDYREMMDQRLEAYHAVIPEDAEVQLLVDGAENGPGLNFTEGPAWVDGKLYFSNMYFDVDFNGDPARSALVEMDPDGAYRYISDGEMQTNGIIPAGNGNLLVADMFGHRVVEMNLSGEVLQVVADSYDGQPIDGPNDIIRDQRGGLYITDPQFTPDAEKYQPGRAVYYLNADGEISRVIDVDEFAMPNGVLLTPDGETLYVNNTYDNETWWNIDTDKDHYIWAYDVNDDGSLSNGRRFAELHLTGNVLDRLGRSSGADGMAIDTEGNIYVATYTGLQIFNSEGSYVGMVNFPTVPVNVTFGGEDLDTLYITSYDKIYSIKTNMRGYQP